MEYVIGRLRPFYVFAQTAARIITKISLYANLARIKVGGHASGVGKKLAANLHFSREHLLFYK